MSDTGKDLRTRRTHCSHGHEYTPENTYVDKKGIRSCRICRKAASDRSNARRKKTEAEDPRLNTRPLPGEEWRPIVGYETLYEVSSLGRVRSLDRGPDSRYHRGRILRLAPMRAGHLSVRLYARGKPRSRTVHHLMGGAFLGAGPDDLVRHLNGVKTDNRLVNLALGTRPGNSPDVRAQRR